MACDEAFYCQYIDGDDGTVFAAGNTDNGVAICSVFFKEILNPSDAVTFDGLNILHCQ